MVIEPRTNASMSQKIPPLQFKSIALKNGAMAELLSTRSRSRPVGESRKPSVDRLLDAAETLLGTHGLDGVSLRQIGVAAGSANNFAVQYHFRDMDGLVQAVLARRMPAVDARQAEILRALDLQGAGGDNRVLLSAMLRPIIEQTNARGERSYARFISALLRSPEGRIHSARLFHLTPATGEIIARLVAVNPLLSRALLEERLRWLSGMVFTSLFNRVAAYASGDAEQMLMHDVLDIAAAGLCLPPSAPR